jgi:hypothetical protein
MRRRVVTSCSGGRARAAYHLARDRPTRIASPTASARRSRRRPRRRDRRHRGCVATPAGGRRSRAAYLGPGWVGGDLHAVRARSPRPPGLDGSGGASGWFLLRVVDHQSRRNRSQRDRHHHRGRPSSQASVSRGGQRAVLHARRSSSRGLGSRRPPRLVSATTNWWWRFPDLGEPTCTIGRPRVERDSRAAGRPPARRRAVSVSAMVSTSVVMGGATVHNRGPEPGEALGADASNVRGLPRAITSFVDDSVPPAREDRRRPGLTARPGCCTFAW